MMLGPQRKNTRTNGGLDLGLDGIRWRELIRLATTKTAQGPK